MGYQSPLFLCYCMFAGCWVCSCQCKDVDNGRGQGGGLAPPVFSREFIHLYVQGEGIRGGIKKRRRWEGEKNCVKRGCGTRCTIIPELHCS